MVRWVKIDHMDEMGHLGGKGCSDNIVHWGQGRNYGIAVGGGSSPQLFENM